MPEFDFVDEEFNPNDLAAIRRNNEKRRKGKLTVTISEKGLDVEKYWKMREAILMRCDLSAVEKLTLMLLSCIYENQVNKDRGIRPSNGYLVKKLGMPKRTVQDAIKSLQDKLHINVVQKSGVERVIYVHIQDEK